jgi:hypothetical protein
MRFPRAHPLWSQQASVIEKLTYYQHRWFVKQKLSGGNVMKASFGDKNILKVFSCSILFSTLVLASCSNTPSGNQTASATNYELWRVSSSPAEQNQRMEQFSGSTAMRDCQNALNYQEAKDTAESQHLYNCVVRMS